MDLRVPDTDSSGKCTAESAAAGEEDADHPLRQQREARGQPQTGGAEAPAVRMAAQQERTGYLGQSLCSQEAIKSYHTLQLLVSHLSEVYKTLIIITITLANVSVFIFTYHDRIIFL